MRTIKDLPELINKLIIETNNCINYPLINSDGYGDIQYYNENNKKRHYLAHRLSYELFNKIKLKPINIILHSCDNPACINPKHLIKGTHADNVQDKVNKNRQAKGEANGRSILTETQVKEIRNSKEKQCFLSKKYGVDKKTIYAIKKNIVWKDI